MTLRATTSIALLFLLASVALPVDAVTQCANTANNGGYDVCVDTDEGSVNVEPTRPDAPSGSATVGVRTYWAQFTATSQDLDRERITFTFSWGDGTTTTQMGSGSTLQEQSATAPHQWNSIGTYCVKAMATDARGKSSAWSPCANVQVVNNPPSTPNSPSGSSYWFGTGTTRTFGVVAPNDPNGDNVRVTFDWGDGMQSVSSSVSPGTTVYASHYWRSSGSYCMRAKATDSAGAESSYSSCRSVTIYWDNRPPTSGSLSGPTIAATGQSSLFQVYVWDQDGDRVGVTWDWGDGTTSTSSAIYSSGSTITRSKTWNAPDRYCVKVRPFDDLGIVGTWSSCRYIDITAANAPPDAPAEPTGPTNVQAGVGYAYEAQTTDPDGDTIQYEFSWGDGSTTTTGFVASGTAVSRSNAWAGSSTRCVKARAIDSVGLIGAWSPCHWVTVTQSNRAPNTPPEPTGPQSVQAGSAGWYYTTATDPDGDTVSFTFSWGDGDTTVTGSYASGSSVGRSNSWPTPGTYCVKTMATDPDGLSSPWSACHWVTVSHPPTPPDACFTRSLDGMAVTVDTGCSSDVNGDALTYTVDWGDGTTSTGSVTSLDDTRTHEYAARGWGTATSQHQGAYTISVTVSDGTYTDTSSATQAVGPSDADLARYWAPVFYHDTAAELDQNDEDYKVQFDEFVAYDFDGNTVGDDNWENAVTQNAPATVYYHVTETTTEYYVGYAIFHPRDFGNSAVASDGFEHENDIETVMLLILKDGTQMGRFGAAMTMAHDALNAYSEQYTGSVCGSTSYDPAYRPGIVGRTWTGGKADTGDVSFSCWSSGKHILLDIEHGGHGVYRHGWTESGDYTPGENDWIYNPGTAAFRGNSGNVYYPSTTGEVPGQVGGEGARGYDSLVRYQLLPIDILWDLRYQISAADEGATTVPYYAWGGLRNCNTSWDCKANAHAPWAIFDRTLGGPRWAQGDWFEHPANLFDRYFADLPTPGPYVYRSVAGAAESYHGNNKGTYDGDGYTEGSVAWVWSRPGAERVRLHLAPRYLESGDTFEVIPPGGQTPALYAGTETTTSTTAWFTGDSLTFVSDGDGDGATGWGWFVSQIEWE